jgi:hypothetical protein
MLHVEINSITADPHEVRELIRRIGSEVRQEAESQPGSLGLSLHVGPGSHVALLEAFWAFRRNAAGGIGDGRAGPAGAGPALDASRNTAEAVQAAAVEATGCVIDSAEYRLVFSSARPS